MTIGTYRPQVFDGIQSISAVAKRQGFEMMNMNEFSPNFTISLFE